MVFPCALRRGSKPKQGLFLVLFSDKFRFSRIGKNGVAQEIHKALAGGPLMMHGASLFQSLMSLAGLGWQIHSSLEGFEGSWTACRLTRTFFTSCYPSRVPLLFRFVVVSMCEVTKSL